MLVAALALIGLFVALYLTLYKTGVIGELACSTGSCETVQLSQWSTLLGLPVAAWGLGFYVLMLALALASLQDALADSRGIALAMAVTSGWGVLFSLWLTYLELFVIHAICTWCVVSAVIVVAMFALSALDWKGTNSEGRETTSEGRGTRGEGRGTAPMRPSIGRRVRAGRPSPACGAGARRSWCRRTGRCAPDARRAGR